jgi:Tfp pilus assembly protein PilF
LTEEDERWVRNEGLRRALHLYPRQRVRTVLTLAEQLRSEGYEDRGRLALEAELPHPEVQLALARWDRDAGHLADARMRIERITGRLIYPASMRSRAWALLAEVRDLDGDSEGASAAAREALQLDAKSTAPHLALASLAERRGDYEASLGHLRAAWGLTPADARLLVRISSVAEKAGEVADARLALERAVELQPDSPALAARLVDFHLRHGQYMEAALRLHRATERFPTDPTLARLAEELQRAVQQR